MPNPGKVGFPLDLNPEIQTNAIQKFQTLREAISFIVFIWLFWNFVLLAGLSAGKPMNNFLTGIDSVVGTPARLLQMLIQ